MSHQYRYQAGIGDVGSYQVSGKPFVTGALNAVAAPGGMIEIEFPSVTQWVTLVNHDMLNSLAYAYSANGHSTGEAGNVAADGMLLGTSIYLEVKCCKMFFTGSDNFDINAGLTGIECSQIVPTDWTGSAGVG